MPKYAVTVDSDKTVGNRLPTHAREEIAALVGVGGPGGGGGTVNAIVAGTNIDVDSSDPANPVVSVEALTADDFTDGATNKVYPQTDKAKLAGIANNATANATDTFLRARANHTGQQSADTIVDGTTNKAFTAAEKTKLGTAYVPGGADIPITQGGTGVSTLPTGLLRGAGTGPITAAVAGTDYVTPSAQAWLARNPGDRLVPVQRIRFYDKPDTVFGSLPTTLDTGHPITYSAGGTPDQAFIADGGLQVTNSPAGAGDDISAAFYANLDAGVGNQLTRIGAKFKLLDGVAGSAGAAVALAFSNGAYLGDGDNAYRMGAHLTVNYQTWQFQTVTNATNELVFNDLTPPDNVLRTPLTWGTGIEYTLEMWRVGDTVIILLPDGQRIPITDPNIALWSGRYGFFEHYLVLRETDILPSFTEAWADTGTQYPPGTSGLVTRDDLESRFVPRVTQVTNETPWTINTDLVDYAENTGLTTDVTVTNPEGTPKVGQKLWIVLQGTAPRAITWGTDFQAGIAALPSTTGLTTARLDVEFIWNATASKWRCIRAGSAAA